MNYDSLRISILKRFKLMLVPDAHIIDSTIDFVESCSVFTNFVIGPDEKFILDRAFPKLKMNTLYSVSERKNGSYYSLMMKQMLHYIDVYGPIENCSFINLNEGGENFKANFVKGIHLKDLKQKITEMAYDNSPLSDIEELVQILKSLDIYLDFSKVQNNELKVYLSEGRILNNGDDVVRYLIWKATNEPLLIKNEEVFDCLKSFYNTRFDLNSYLEHHMLPLSQVFNRHKAVIMCLKGPKTRTVINKISKMSKTNHVPIKESLNKTFISKALSNPSFNFELLSKISPRDKLKFLYLIDKRSDQDLKNVIYQIRNGKVWVGDNKHIGGLEAENLKNEIYSSLVEDFSHLKDAKIRLDPLVLYGFPISDKQKLGNLPFFSRVSIEGESSGGIYWENSWGAHDLDLSSISMDGSRVGWGGDDFNESVIYSGDVTNAPEGAMEFMTSSDRTFALVVNIFSGAIDSDCETVFGHNGKECWIDSLLIREKFKLESHNNIIGIINNSTFIAYKGRLNNNFVSQGSLESTVLNSLNLESMTINELFDILGIKYETDLTSNETFDYDLAYDGFTYDKLSDMLYK